MFELIIKENHQDVLYVFNLNMLNQKMILTIKMLKK